MTKKLKDIETEELIKKTAKRMFFKEGRFRATTQEIADEAGVNRTLINYYFRSRDKLLELVFEDAMKREDDLRQKLMLSDLPFKEKIEKHIELSLQQAKEYPYLETYIVSRINDEGSCETDKTLEEQKVFKIQFFKEYKKEVMKGTIEDIPPIQFLLNLASLINFPIAIRPLLQAKLNLADEEFDQIISDRKEIIMKMLFKN